MYGDSDSLAGERLEAEPRKKPTKGGRDDKKGTRETVGAKRRKKKRGRRVRRAAEAKGHRGEDPARDREQGAGTQPRGKNRAGQNQKMIKRKREVGEKGGEGQSGGQASQKKGGGKTKGGRAGVTRKGGLHAKQGT